MIPLVEALAAIPVLTAAVLVQTRAAYHPKELAAVAVAVEMPMLVQRMMAPVEEEEAGTAVPAEEEEAARTLV